MIDYLSLLNYGQGRYTRPFVEDFANLWRLFNAVGGGGGCSPPDRNRHHEELGPLVHPGPNNVPIQDP